MNPSTKVQLATETMPMHRYHFNLTGSVKELSPLGNKAVIQFNLNGTVERALMLAKVAFGQNGKSTLEDAMKPNQSIADFFKINETIYFDCHIYDKGGMGSGKDRCNFFVLKAWKADEEKSSGTSGTHCKTDTGWLSEVYANSGVITFTSGVSGVDQRVSCKYLLFTLRLRGFKNLSRNVYLGIREKTCEKTIYGYLFFSSAVAANRVYFYEKRTSPGIYLPSILKLGDIVSFEAIPAAAGVNYAESILPDDFCAFVALLVWKGKRPQVDMGSLVDNTSQTPSCITNRKDSLDSSSSSDLNTDQDVMSSSFSSFLILPSAGKPAGLLRGVGMIGNNTFYLLIPKWCI